MKLLFFPSDLGGGLGHVSRCLALAEEARRRGHHSVFVLHNPKHVDRVRRRFPAHLCRNHRPLASIASALGAAFHRRKPQLSRPLFIEFSGLDYQVPRDGLLQQADVERRLAQYLRLVRSEGPDLLVGDTNLLVWFLSRRAGVPVAQLVRAASHPDSARIIWWKTEPDEIKPPRSAALFNSLLERWGLEPIQRAEDLLRGDRYLVPSIPEIEPIPTDERTVHVGALIDGEGEKPPAWLGEMPAKQPLVYLTMGGGAGPVGSRKFLETVIETFAGKPIQAVFSTGGTLPAEGPGELPDNIRVLPWVPGRHLIDLAQLVVFHGGYGTMMESLSAGKPLIVVPFQSEQEGNGQRLEQLGCGQVIQLSHGGWQTVTQRWPQGSYSYRVQETYDLSAEAFAASLDRLLCDPSFGERAERLGKKIRSGNGPQQALEILESLAMGRR